MKAAVAFALALAIVAPLRSEAAEKVNASILPSIWYSNLTHQAGNTLRIYGAVQNNSGIDFSGVAHFMVDGREVADQSFRSTSGSLSEVDASWRMVAGTHSISIKVTTDPSFTDELVAYQSDSSPLVVTEPPKPVDATQATLDAATAIASSTGAAATALADALESLKDPSAGSLLNPSAIAAAAHGKAGLTASSTPYQPYLAAAYNSGIDLAVFLVRQWPWTLAAILIGWFLLKLRSKGSELP